MIPNAWVATGFKAGDGKDLVTKQQGIASVKITGKVGVTKTLTQTIQLSGGAGDLFTFSYWSKDLAVPKGSGKCRAEVLLFNGSTQVFAKIVDCVTGNSSFKKRTLSFVNPTSPYTVVVIKFIYTKPYGTIWFDGISLIR